MKRLLSFLTVLLLFICLSSSSCKKDKSKSPVDQLPPETQTGANTFGCLVDGKAFKPAGSALSGPNLACTYQYIYLGSSSGYVFGLHADNKKDPCDISGIGLGIDSSLVIEGNYILKNAKKGQFGADFIVNKCFNPLIIYSTSDIVTGLLTIKKMDTINQIVSGTFWFDAVNDNGDIVKVTDGRFDVRFTR